MEEESRPGYPECIYLGNNYAQPVSSHPSHPGGNELDRVESYLGIQNWGAPNYNPGESTYGQGAPPGRPASPPGRPAKGQRR